MTPDELRAALAQAGLDKAPQQQVARRIGVTTRALRFWLTGERPVPQVVSNLLAAWRQLDAIADAGHIGGG